MIYGGSLASRRMRSRDDVSGEFADLDLDQRLPTSMRGSLATAAADLAELGVQPGRYSGVEHLFEPGGACLAAATAPSTCEITRDGFLTVISRTSGEPTSFGWVSNRWRWSPYPGVTIDAVPRVLGALTVIDFFRCQGSNEAPVARLCLALERRG